MHLDDVVSIAFFGERASCGSSEIYKGEALGSASSFSQRAMTAEARQLPVTLREVRAISMSASTPRITKIGSVGRWKVAAEAMRTSRLARGTPAMPLLVSINVRTIKSCCGQVM